MCIYIHIDTYTTFTYIYIHIHAYTYIHMHIHTYTYIYIHLHIHTYTYIYICMCICICTYAQMHIFTFAFTHAFAFTCTYIHACMHAYIHTYIHSFIHTYIRDRYHLDTHIYFPWRGHRFLHAHTPEPTQPDAAFLFFQDLDLFFAVSTARRTACFALQPNSSQPRSDLCAAPQLASYFSVFLSFISPASYRAMRPAARFPLHHIPVPGPLRTDFFEETTISTSCWCVRWVCTYILYSFPVQAWSNCRASK